jgi:hypothetical protein
MQLNVAVARTCVTPRQAFRVPPALPPRIDSIARVAPGGRVAPVWPGVPGPAAAFRTIRFGPNNRAVWTVGFRVAVRVC